MVGLHLIGGPRAAARGVGAACRLAGVSCATVHRAVGAALPLLASGAIAAAPPSGNPRDTECRVLRGSLEPACNAAICTQGAVTGDLHGRYTSKVTSIYPAGSGWIYTSWIAIELDGEKGRIDLLSAATAPRDVKGGPDLSQGTEVLTIAEASGAYQDHRGTFVVSGARALGRPTAYVGTLCHPTSAAT
jgi:hypothetical protein